MKKINTISSFLVIFCIAFCMMGGGLAPLKNPLAIIAAERYQCVPCGQDCDNKVYNEPGKCPHCQMELVKKSSVTFKTITPEEICNYIRKHPNVVLLDVRTKEEFEGKADPDFGTLKNAVNIPIQVLQSQLASISNLKKKEIIVYCSHSHRSPQACYLLSQTGFKNVINMSGGMSVMKDNSCMK